MVQAFLRYGCLLGLLALVLACPAMAQQKAKTNELNSKPRQLTTKPVTPPKSQAAHRKNVRTKTNREQNELIEKTGDDDAGVKRAKAYDKSIQQKFSTAPRTASPAGSKKLAKEQSKQFRNYKEGQGETLEEQRAKAYDKSRQQTFINKNYSASSPEYQKHQAKETSQTAADYAEGGSSREIKKARAYDKSRQILFSNKLNTAKSAEARRGAAYDNNRRLNYSTKLEKVASPETTREKAKDKSERIAETAKGNTMDRAEYRKMLKAKGKKMIATTKGNTMLRTDYDKMVERKSKKMARAEKGNTLAPESHDRLIKNKSEDIADYDAGYLNTKAERRARWRSLIHPKDYQANSPEEVHAKAKRKSNELASFEGRRKRSSRRKIENATPSSRAYNNKVSLASMDARGSAQRRGARQVARNKKSYLPVWLRKKPGKVKYDDVEKGIWNE